MSAIVTEPPVINLTAEDRCDRCYAQAYHQCTMGKLELLLCHHHQRQHGAKMVEEGWTVITDESRPL